jgi:hypothetical protein
VGPACLEQRLTASSHTAGGSGQFTNTLGQAGGQFKHPQRPSPPGQLQRVVSYCPELSGSASVSDRFSSGFLNMPLKIALKSLSFSISVILME